MSSRKIPKIQLISPFPEITNNWELVTEIESSLNQYITNALVITKIPQKEDLEPLGKSGLQQLVIIAKQLLHFVQILRSQHKFVEQIKAEAAIAKQKLQQHDQLVRNNQKKHFERTKAISEENRVLKENNEKMKRTFIDNQQALKISLQEIKGEALSLRNELTKLQAEKKHLLQAINKLQEDIGGQQEIINRLQKVANDELTPKTMKNKLDDMLQIKIQRRMKPLYAPKQVQINGPPLQTLGMRDLSALSQLLSFLTPSQILTMALLNKRIRVLCHTQACIRALCGSIIGMKNKKIGYYHRHINYFEKMCHKIPEEVIQMAYFRYHILKESAGHEIMQALNASSLIFQGRFEGQQLYTGLPQNSKQIPNKLNFEESNVLEVEPSIVNEFKEERVQERDQLIKLFEEMYGKIKTTYELYRADQESSTLFISNTLKHISRVFVLSKFLYLQVQSLQQLNSFLLAQLNKWDRMQIDKNLQIEDLRAQLQAQKKLKLFFTDKSIKSQQKALLQENLKLTYEMKYTKQNDLLDYTVRQKDSFAKKAQQLTKANQRLSTQCRQIRKAYEVIRQKYNHVTEELVVVKETIIKMNII